MPTDEICSWCYIQRHAILQNNSCSVYNGFYKDRFEYIQSRCDLTGDTDILPQPVPVLDEGSLCVTGATYTTEEGDTCGSIALAHSASSAALFIGNMRKIVNCSNVFPGAELCLPFPCEKTYVVQSGDARFDIERRHLAEGVRFKDIQRFNPWVKNNCDNLVSASENAYRHVICLSPQNGLADSTVPGGNGDAPGWRPPSGWAHGSLPLPSGATLARGTVQECRVWHTVEEDDSCALLSIKGPTTIDVLLLVNPSLGIEFAGCDARLVPGLTYSALPTVGAVPGDVNDGPVTTTTSTIRTLTTSRAESPTPVDPSPPGPTHSGIPEDCNRWHVVQGTKILPRSSVLPRSFGRRVRT